MGVTRTTHIAGDGPQPTKGQTVKIEYTGWLKDPSQPDNKGKQWATTPLSCVKIVC
jgi:FK506-binding protein 1